MCNERTDVTLPEPQPRFSATVARQKQKGQEVSIISSTSVCLFRISVLLIVVGLYTEEKRKISLLSGMQEEEYF